MNGIPEHFLAAVGLLTLVILTLSCIAGHNDVRSKRINANREHFDPRDKLGEFQRILNRGKR